MFCFICSFFFFRTSICLRSRSVTPRARANRRFSSEGDDGASGWPGVQTKDAVVRAQFISNNRSAKVIAFAVRYYYCNVPRNTHNRTRSVNSSRTITFWCLSKAVFTRSPEYYTNEITGADRPQLIHTQSYRTALLDTRQWWAIDCITWSETVFVYFFTNTGIHVQILLHIRSPIIITFLSFLKTVKKKRKKGFSKKKKEKKLLPIDSYNSYNIAV